MKTNARIFCLLGGLMAAGAMPAMAQTAETAQTGKQAGSIMVRARLIDVIPQTTTSSVSVIGGGVEASNTPAPEVDFSYFFTENLAAELILATTRHDVTATKTVLGNVPVGHTWVLPPTLTAQYHFNPKGVFSPYVGAGVNYTVFYNAKGDGGAVTKLVLENNFGEVIQAGIDVRLTDHVYANLDVKQIFLNTTAKLNGGAIRAKTALNPTVVGIGLGYRF